MRHGDPNRYACLAVMPESVHLATQKVVGVVDAAAMADRNVLKGLPGVEEYLFISGMAVDAKYRWYLTLVSLEAGDRKLPQFYFKLAT